ncbi:MAG: hypothetical protein RIG61_12015 [Deltaproteobacteria bacterium]
MRKLLAIAALSLALVLPSVSFADIHAFGVKTPVVKSEVSSQAKGGKVEKDFISFYISPKGESVESNSKVSDNSSEDDSFTVFGVRLSSTQKS